MEYDVRPGGTFRGKANPFLQSTGVPEVILDGAPIHARLVSGDDLQAGGGWPFILNNLKSVLETGSSLMAAS